MLSAARTGGSRHVPAPDSVVGATPCTGRIADASTNWDGISSCACGVATCRVYHPNRFAPTCNTGKIANDARTSPVTPAPYPMWNNGADVPSSLTPLTSTVPVVVGLQSSPSGSALQSRPSAPYSTPAQSLWGSIVGGAVPTVHG